MELFGSVYFGAALLLLLASLPALEKISFKPFGDRREARRRFTWRDLWECEAGVVVVTYCHPLLGAPTTTAPTAAQASQIPELAAVVFMADADTAATITHNWGLANSFPNWLWPQVFISKVLGAAGDAYASFTFGLTNTNSVTLTKGNTTAGTGGTYNVYLRKPHSVGQ